MSYLESEQKVKANGFASQTVYFAACSAIGQVIFEISMACRSHGGAIFSNLFNYCPSVI